MVTGLLYVDPEASDLHEALETVDMPLNTLADKDLVPGAGTSAGPRAFAELGFEVVSTDFSTAAVAAQKHLVRAPLDVDLRARVARRCDERDSAPAS